MFWGHSIQAAGDPSYQTGAEFSDQLTCPLQPSPVSQSPSLSTYGVPVSDRDEPGDVREDGAHAAPAFTGEENKPAVNRIVCQG